MCLLGLCCQSSMFNSTSSIMLVSCQNLTCSDLFVMTFPTEAVSLPDRFHFCRVTLAEAWTFPRPHPQPTSSQSPPHPKPPFSCRSPHVTPKTPVRLVLPGSAQDRATTLGYRGLQPGLPSHHCLCQGHPLPTSPE